MTQMGLEYLKLQENRRHNLMSESVEQQKADTGTREADTHAYSASFEPQRVAATKMQAEASASQAATAERKQDLSEKYAERDMRAKEKTASAKALQAEVSDRQNSPELLERSVKAKEDEAYAKLINMLPPTSRALLAQGRSTEISPPWLMALEVAIDQLSKSGMKVTGSDIAAILGML